MKYLIVNKIDKKTGNITLSHVFFASQIVSISSNNRDRNGQFVIDTTNGEYVFNSDEIDLTNADSFRFCDGIKEFYDR